MDYNCKYPVVLVHGMMLKDFKLYRAFRKIKDVLKDNGVHVYVSNQDGVGSIENNAKQLKEEINEILKKENAKKVNIIAHSKGGIDSRYMISMLDMEDKVASLTTLSTPHHGSNMSRKLLTMPKWIASIIAFFTNTFYKINGDEHPDIIRVGEQLTDTYMKEFNKKVINSNKVYYQSYSSDIAHKKSFVIFLPKEFSKYCENESTDGIVSISSSVWGDYKGNMDNDYDHAEMVGAYGSKKTLNEVSRFYLSIIKELKVKGF